MHLFNNRVTSVAAFALALALSASQASAQKATFTLPFEAHWGSAILPPGEYMMEAPSAGSIFPVFYITGNGKSVLLNPANTQYGTTYGRSCLELKNIAGTYFVDKFDSGTTGKSFTFGIPKVARHQAIGKAEGTATIIEAATK